MKRRICWPVCVCLVLFSCSKLNDIGDRSKLLLKEFVVGSAADYHFYYNAGLFLDSVVETGPDLRVTYRVVRHAWTIDSILTLSNGLVTQSTTDIRYDDSGRITHYLVYNRM